MREQIFAAGVKLEASCGTGSSPSPNAPPASGFRVGWRAAGWGVDCCFSGVFCSCWRGFHFGGGGWALGYHSMGLGHFPDVSLYAKILSVKLFGDSRGNSYIPCL